MGKVKKFSFFPLHVAGNFVAIAADDDDVLVDDQRDIDVWSISFARHNFCWRCLANRSKCSNNLLKITYKRPTIIDS